MRNDVGARVMAMMALLGLALGAAGCGRADNAAPAGASTTEVASTSTPSPTIVPPTTVPPPTPPTTTVPPPAVPPTTVPPPAVPPPTVPPPTVPRPPVPAVSAAPGTTRAPAPVFDGDPDTFRRPMNGRLNVTLAWDCGGCVAELGSLHHPAIDYRSRDDDTIVAAGHGVVVWFNDGCDSPSQGCGQSMGNSIFLRHALADGSQIFTFYAHLAELDPAVVVGACVAQGQRLGLMGNSGIGSAAHLHFAFQTSTEILQYTIKSSYESGSRDPDGFYGAVKVQRCG